MQLCSELAGSKATLWLRPMSNIHPVFTQCPWQQPVQIWVNSGRFCSVTWAAQLYCFAGLILSMWKTACGHCTVWMGPSLRTTSPEFCRFFVCSKAMLKTVCLDVQTDVLLKLVSTSGMLPFRQNLKYLRRVSWAIYISYMLRRITDFKEILLHVCNRSKWDFIL